jgi:diaminopimelate decarboxylase
MKETLPFSSSQLEVWTAKYPTPFYIYDESGIRETVTSLKEAFSWNNGFREHFAVKATPTPAILRLLASLDCGTDCASIPELVMSERCGITGQRIVFSANETKPEEYKVAFDLGAIINLDDLTQVESMKQGCGFPDTICCRYNPGQFKITNDIMGHLYDSKFGMPKEHMLEVFKTCKENGTEHFGIHAMLASCSLDEEYYPNLARELFNLVLEIRETLGITVEFIDLSGGIGIPYKPDEKAVNIAAIGEGVHRAYDEILKANGIELRLMTELGRYITGPHGYLVTKVVGMKHIYKEYIGVDASASNLMRPAIYGSYHHISVPAKADAPCDTMVDVVGPLCENNDKFAIDRMLPKLDYGDILVIQDAGAHGHSMGYTYNGRLRCAEYMLEGDGELKMIRRAQTMDDYFATLDVDEEFTSSAK